MSSNQRPLIGAHTSIAGGLYRALEQAAAIDATTTQIFTANQRQWHPKQPTQDDIDRFKAVQKSTGIEKVMSHASYLLNLGSPRAQGNQKSRTAFREEIKRCRSLDIPFLNFHPGAALDDTREACLARIAESMLAMQDLLPDNKLTLVLEMTAGQGTVVGCRLEEIAYIVKETAPKIPVGVCIDTCHIFAAGYDIRTAQKFEETLNAFDQQIGLPFLTAFHLNDSIHPLESRKDRHAPLGKGAIGYDAFSYLMQNKKIAHIPKYLETPGGPDEWKTEIQWLKKHVHTTP